MYQITRRHITEGSNLHRWHTLLQERSWLRYYITSRKVAGSSPDAVDLFNWPSPSSRTMTLGLTESLIEMSTRNLPGGKGRPARKADNVTAICEPIV
jgi:hypothetical protein